jgi:hypothetical protein
MIARRCQVGQNFGRFAKCGKPISMEFIRAILLELEKKRLSLNTQFYNNQQI